MTTNTQHYEFETWHAANFDYKITFYSKNDDGSYINQNLRHDYEIWQAALASQPAQDALPQAMECGGNGPIDANKLEAIAKERPDDFFLKGSGVLKLTGAIRQLEREIRSLKDVAQPPAQPAIDQNPEAWMVPCILSFKGARTSCPVEMQPDIEGTVMWSPEIFCDDFEAVKDKHGVEHVPYALGRIVPPLPSTPVSAQQVMSDEEIADLYHWSQDQHLRPQDRRSVLQFARALLQKAGASGMDAKDAQLDEIHNRLTLLEWGDYRYNPRGESQPSCPVCAEFRDDGHAKDCGLQALIEVSTHPSPDNVDAQRTGDE